MREHDEVYYDTLPGNTADETDVQINDTRGQTTIVQRIWGESTESVTLDDDQMLALVTLWCERHGFTVN